MKFIILINFMIVFSLASCGPQREKTIEIRYGKPGDAVDPPPGSGLGIDGDPAKFKEAAKEAAKSLKVMLGTIEPQADAIAKFAADVETDDKVLERLSDDIRGLRLTDKRSRDITAADSKNYADFFTKTEDLEKKIAAEKIVDKGDAVDEIAAEAVREVDVVPASSKVRKIADEVKGHATEAARHVQDVLAVEKKLASRKKAVEKTVSDAARDFEMIEGSRGSNLLDLYKKSQDAVTLKDLNDILDDPRFANLRADVDEKKPEVLVGIKKLEDLLGDAATTGVIKKAIDARKSIDDRISFFTADHAAVERAASELDIIFGNDPADKPELLATKAGGWLIKDALTKMKEKVTAAIGSGKETTKPYYLILTDFDKKISFKEKGEDLELAKAIFDIHLDYANDGIKRQAEFSSKKMKADNALAALVNTDPNYAAAEAKAIRASDRLGIINKVVGNRAQLSDYFEAGAIQAIRDAINDAGKATSSKFTKSSDDIKRAVLPLTVKELEKLLTAGNVMPKKPGGKVPAVGPENAGDEKKFLTNLRYKVFKLLNNNFKVEFDAARALLIQTRINGLKLRFDTDPTVIKLGDAFNDLEAFAGKMPTDIDAIMTECGKIVAALGSTLDDEFLPKCGVRDPSLDLNDLDSFTTLRKEEDDKTIWHKAERLIIDAVAGGKATASLGLATAVKEIILDGKIEIFKLIDLGFAQAPKDLVDKPDEAVANVIKAIKEFIDTRLKEDTVSHLKPMVLDSFQKLPNGFYTVQDLYDVMINLLTVNNLSKNTKVPPYTYKSILDLLDAEIGLSMSQQDFLDLSKKIDPKSSHRLSKLSSLLTRPEYEKIVEVTRPMSDDVLIESMRKAAVGSVKTATGDLVGIQDFEASVKSVKNAKDDYSFRLAVRELANFFKVSPVKANLIKIATDVEIDDVIFADDKRKDVAAVVWAYPTYLALKALSEITSVDLSTTAILPKTPADNTSFAERAILVPQILKPSLFGIGAEIDLVKEFKTTKDNLTDALSLLAAAALGSTTPVKRDSDNLEPLVRAFDLVFLSSIEELIALDLSGPKDADIGRILDEITKGFAKKYVEYFKGFKSVVTSFIVPTTNPRPTIQELEKLKLALDAQSVRANPSIDALRTIVDDFLR